MEAATASRLDPSDRAADPLGGLSPMQRSIVEHRAPVRQVIAAAGSGKTKTVIALAEHAALSDGVPPERILFLSFSRKAVAEIRSRLRPELAARMEVSTFHSFCYRRLPEVDASLRGRRVMVLGEKEKETFLLDQLRQLGPALQGTPYELLLRRPDVFRREFPGEALRVFRALAAHKRATGQLEYDDLISRMVAAVGRPGPDVEALRERYRLVIVDEFQDTDPRQLRFLKLLNPPKLVVVGDDWQAIYGFRGADVRPFLDFRRHFRDAARLRLSENYRSLRPIIELGIRIIRSSRRKLRKRVTAVRGRAPRPGLPVLSLQLPTGGESALVRLLPANCDAFLLVRSNFRRRLWARAGFPAERVLTIHRAKGLEFPVVFLDLAGGWTGRGGANDDTDEELRIAYVGVTRAQNLLCLLGASSHREVDHARRILSIAAPVVCAIELKDLEIYLKRELQIRKPA